MNTSDRPIRPIHLIDCLLLLVCAFIVGLWFLKSPGLGDDFTYWRTALAIREHGVEGWDPNSFHNLRWPMWGFVLVLQDLFGPGLFSFYAVPFTYLGLGAIVVYAISGRLLHSRAAGWAAAIAFFFHPLLDSVIFRPMPDLAEGTFIGLGVLCWLALVDADHWRKRLFFALTTGVIAGIAFSNRFTGIFIFGVLGAVALVTLFNTHRLKWKEAVLWLGVIGLTALTFFCIEGLIYQRITGDFLHNIHANMGAKGRKGTESVNVFLLPFRFVDSLSGRGFIGPFYLTLTLIGAGLMSWKGGLRGRVVVAWGLTLYLAYSCALQEFFPPRPLLRNADRFLTSLALPFSILAVAGAAGLLAYLPRVKAAMGRRTLFTAAVAIVLLGLATRRPYFSPGHIPALRAYIQSLPDGTTIYTQEAMRSAALMAAPEKAQRLNWILRKHLLHRLEGAEEAKEADEFWFCRKLTWLRDRQGIERDQIQEQSELSPIFTEPEKTWQLTKVINVGGVPEYVFYRKRPAGEKQPEPQEAGRYFTALPSMPFHWEGKGGFELEKNVEIPEMLRGKAVALRFEGKSNFVQAFRGRVIFMKGDKRIEEISLRPYFHPTDGVDFYHIAIPKEATRAKVCLNVDKRTRSLTLNHLFLFFEE